MALFGFGKKNEDFKKAACCCGGTSVSEGAVSPACSCKGTAYEFVASEGCCGNSEGGIWSVKVLGTGCRSCHELYDASKAATKELDLNVEVAYITDMETIAGYGVMSMPALVINEKVVSMGKALKTAEVIRLLHDLYRRP